MPIVRVLRIAMLLCALLSHPRGRRCDGDIVAFVSRDDHDLLPSACARVDCVELQASSTPLPRARARVVILSGRSAPPTMLGVDAEHLARAVASLHPALIVADTCFGLRYEYVDALTRHGWRGWLVGTSTLLPVAGLRYPPAFWRTGDPIAQRAESLRAHEGFEVHAVYVDRARVVAMRRALDQWMSAYDPQRGAELLDWVDPPLHLLSVNGQPAFTAYVPGRQAP